MKPLLELEHVSFAYGNNIALTDVSLHIESGQICCLLGPSGCGKTSLIRIIAGFEQPSSGSISLAGQIIANSTINQPVQQRNVGMVFQDLTLFPHLDVEQNIGFGLGDLTDTQVKQRTNELLDLCRLVDLKQRYPHQISGGQQQRVALARALAPKPQLLLLDEPFSSVDSSLQRQLGQEVRDMLIADNATAIWVTHDLEEAFTVADKIGLINGGILQQWSAPKDLYENPVNLTVAKFLNHGELLNGELLNDDTVNTAIGKLNVNKNESFAQQQNVQVLVNKKYFFIDFNGAANAQLIRCLYLGGHYLFTVRLNSGEVISFINDEHHKLTVDDELCVKAGDNTYCCF